MNDERRLERLLIDVLEAGAPSRPPDRLIPETLRAVRDVRRWPRWLAHLKEPPMRVSSRVAVGSPMARVTAFAAASLLLVLALTGALVAGASLTSTPDEPLPAPYGTAGSGVIVFSHLGDLYSTGPDGRQSVDIVTETGVDTNPTFAHDGTRFSFLRSSEGIVSVMLAEPDGSHLEVVSSSESSEIGVPAWSPDDQTLAFIETTDGRPAVVLVEAREDATLRRLDLGGIEPRVLVGWRPQGGEELIIVGQPDPSSPALAVYAARTDGSGHRMVGDVGDELAFQSPRLSPDGSLVVFWNWETNEEGVTGAWGHARDLESGADNAISETHGVGGFGATFSPSGADLLFEDYGREGVGSLHLIPWSGGSARAVGAEYPDVMSPRAYAFSPDGSTILVTLADGTASLVDIATSQVTTTAINPLDGGASWQRLAPNDPDQPSVAWSGEASGFVRPFTFDVPAGRSVGPPVQLSLDISGQSHAAHLVGLSEPASVAASVGPTGSLDIQQLDQAHGILFASLEPVFTHACGGTRGQREVPAAPAGFLGELRSIGGFGLGDVAVASVDARAGWTARLDPTRSLQDCGRDLHIASGGIASDFVSLRVPSQLTVLDVAGQAILIDVWARSEADLDSWLPVANEIIRTIRFRDS